MGTNWAWFHRFGSPPHVYRLAGLLTPWFAWPAALSILAALYGGLVLAPPGPSCPGAGIGAEPLAMLGFLK